MDLLNQALAALPKESALAGTDMKIAYANVLATLAVAEQLSRINGSSASPSTSTD